MAIDVIGPRSLLVGSVGKLLPVGQAVRIVVSNDNEADAVVVRKLPHATGLRYVLALDADVAAICELFPERIRIELKAESAGFVGSADVGSDSETLVFEPTKELGIGDPVTTRHQNATGIYQVANMELAMSSWAGAESVVPRATAQIVGRLEENQIRADSRLPDAHERIQTGEWLSATLPNNYYEIGTVKRTKIPVGMIVDETRSGHLAILGMSGMGKTAVSQRICKRLGTDHVVIALDTTGEYSSRLGFPAWTQNDFTTLGHFVYEPVGDPPIMAEKFIESCMRVAAEEYKTGTPIPRVILLEEAHTFLPEWNFVGQRNHTEFVSKSTRAIMQARKFNITFVIVSQRTAVVSKSAISQCENYVILKTLDHTGLEYLESLVGPKMRDAIPRLERYESMCVGPAFNTEMPVIAALSAP